ncbi:MAG TPA: prolyl oligopeptidase family serine peptidase [Usitatibacter sp.]|nr:prolyl oligopeptidase family serine peptidase [Usitatibacter sp.]
MRLRAAACFALFIGIAGAAVPLPGPGPAGVRFEGVTPIPASVDAALRPYLEFRSHELWSWHASRREVLVGRVVAGVRQVHQVSEPGKPPRPLTISDGGANKAWASAGKDDFVFVTGDSPRARLFFYDAAASRVTPISPEGAAAQGWAWSPKGDRFAYTTRSADGAGGRRTELHLANPARPNSGKPLASWRFGAWTSFAFSPDGRRLVGIERRGDDSAVWIIEVRSGKQRRITRRGMEPIRYGSPAFTRDGRGILARSDRDFEFPRLVHIDAATGKERVLAGSAGRGVEAFALSSDAALAAFITNESGASVLRFYDLQAWKELPRPPLLHGVIGGLQWRPRSRELGFHIASARSAGDVFSYELDSNGLTRWTNGNSPGVNTRELAEPRMIRWNSFDGLGISGLHYHPPERFTGKRPVVVAISSGAGLQARPGFIGPMNHLVGDLGIAVIYPNVRGSSGFGKSFRELGKGDPQDAVKDIGALLDWIAAQPDLDASKVVLADLGGASVAAATARAYADRVAGSVSASTQPEVANVLAATIEYARRVLPP